MQNNKEPRTEQKELFLFDPVVILLDIIKRWYVVVIAALLAGVLAYIVSNVRYVPSYETTTTFVVSSKDSSATVYQNLSAASNLAGVFSEVLNSSLLRSAVLEAAELDVFRGTITASAVEDTNLMILKVSAPDPREAFLVTRAILDNHHIVSYQVLGDTILEVLQAPKVPTAPSNSPNAGSNMKKAAVLVGFAVFALLGVLSYTKDTVRSKREGEEVLDCRVLGEVAHVRKYRTLKAYLEKKKTSILITNPVTSFMFVETIQKLRRKVEQQLPAKGGVVMVTSVLENEGKSTIAVNIALALAQKHKKVLLLDCDLRKPACHRILEYPWHTPGVIGVATGKMKMEESVLPLKNTNLSLLLERKGLPSSTEVAGSEGMKRLIAEARMRYDYVVVDTPPMSVAPDTECLMELCDVSLLVVQQNVVKAVTVNSAVETLQNASSKFVGCVINNVYGHHFGLNGGYGYGYGYGYGGYGKYGKYGSARK